MLNLSSGSLWFQDITEADTESDYLVYRSTREDELSRTGWPEAEKTQFALSQFELQRTQYRQFYQESSFQLIRVDAALAGRLFIHEGMTEIRIIDLALLPQWRNQGIGSKILTGIITHAAAQGKKITIHVEIFNPARALYERLGFAIIETRGMHYLMQCIPKPQFDTLQPQSCDG